MKVKLTIWSLKKGLCKCIRLFINEFKKPTHCLNYVLKLLLINKYEKNVNELKKLGRNLGVIFKLNLFLSLKQAAKIWVSTFSDIERNKKTILTCFAMEKNLSEWKKLIESANHENISSKKKSIYNFFIENNLKKNLISFWQIMLINVMI